MESREGPANKANVAELESDVFIGLGWACEGYKAAKSRRQPFQCDTKSLIYLLQLNNIRMYPNVLPLVSYQSE